MLLARQNEAYNSRGSCALTFAVPIISAVEECNLLEESPGPATYEGSELRFEIKPFEIKTLPVHLTNF